MLLSLVRTLCLLPKTQHFLVVTLNEVKSLVVVLTKIKKRFFVALLLRMTAWCVITPSCHSECNEESNLYKPK